jgi:hypothetical protein
MSTFRAELADDSKLSMSFQHEERCYCFRDPLLVICSEFELKCSKLCIRRHRIIPVNTAASLTVF